MTDTLIVEHAASRIEGCGDAYRYAADLAARHVRRRIADGPVGDLHTLAVPLVREAVACVGAMCDGFAAGSWPEHARETAIAVARRAALGVFESLASSPDWGDVYAVMAWRRGAESGFLQTHGVREYRNSHRNVLRVLKSAGDHDAAARRLADRIGAYGLQEGPFDHGMIFGRDRVPLLLVGHPYGLTSEDGAMLESVQALGLIVRTGGEGFYGFGTRQVIVASPWMESI